MSKGALRSIRAGQRSSCSKLFSMYDLQQTLDFFLERTKLALLQSWQHVRQVIMVSSVWPRILHTRRWVEGRQSAYSRILWNSNIQTKRIQLHARAWQDRRLHVPLSRSWRWEIHFICPQFCFLMAFTHSLCQWPTWLQRKQGSLFFLLRISLILACGETLVNIICSGFWKGLITSSNGLASALATPPLPCTPSTYPSTYPSIYPSTYNLSLIDILLNIFFRLC